MTVIYRTAGAWGAGKGTNLQPAEVDGNFYDHEGRIATLESSFSSVSQIDYFAISGYDLYVHMTDHTVLGPYTLPSTPTWTFTGPWAAVTAYSANDVFTALGNVYLVAYDHTSASTFDPGANDGNAHNYYQLLLSVPATPVYTLTGSNVTLSGTYANSYMRYTNIAGCTVTISSGVFPVNTELHFRVANDVGVTLVASGVTFDIPTGFLAQCSTHGGVITAKQYATDAWDLFGLLNSA